jgi:hypothetical protein
VASHEQTGHRDHQRQRAIQQNARRQSDCISLGRREPRQDKIGWRSESRLE